ncbi:hypothetical protein EJ06DRAFT_523374 [Trichodelitschia bisporula]|uniref:DUF8035 domain-containing protein n=1 Tax=Trichodelitschia bisporula TaxID=703511 RepID=A0A6G1HPZ7_9PEZI|nr:hypothetical protein EJ06DRAFT_523374 [Trichodelitschia bisporula]
MASRRNYPVADLYEERHSDYYRNNGRRTTTREYDELDVELARSNGPAFLRDDYGRSSNAGALVVRSQHEEIDRPAPRRREIEKDELIIRDRDSRPPRRRHRSHSRDDIVFRHSEASLPLRGGRQEETDIYIRHSDDKAPRHPRHRDVERDEFVVRRSEPDLTRTREVERDEFIVRRGEGERRAPRGREVEKEEIIIRRDEQREDRGRQRSVSRERISIREKSRVRGKSQPPQLIGREREEFVVRRRAPPTPPPRQERETITIKRTEARSPTPPPEPKQPEPIVRPPIVQEIHQEIITHHRHIDHGKYEDLEPRYSPRYLHVGYTGAERRAGVERARSLSPLPPPREPTPPRDTVESLEIDIRRRNGRGGDWEEDITFERTTRDDKQPSRRRSVSARRPRYHDDLEEEAEFYNRKALERGYVGEGYNGATKDWTIVDVPPGTERVKMDGAGGGSQEITWQRFNGVRRSKFMAGDREFDSGFGQPASNSRRKSRTQDMWTEITKDLVLKDAIEEMGYDYEETEYFFYVMEYLRYEDVLQLVEISDEIRRHRNRRLRELEWERDEFHSERGSRRGGGYDDRYYEREVVVDTSKRRY